MMESAGLSRLHQISMRATDLPRAVNFYKNVLGVRLLFEVPPGLAFFDLAGVRLMLSLPAPGFDHPGSVLYFGVEDIHQTAAALEEKGLVFRTPPHKIATLVDREVWLAEFQDTEGNTLALMSEPRL